jgi:hypothetical protein
MNQTMRIVVRSNKRPYSEDTVPHTGKTLRGQIVLIPEFQDSSRAKT